MALPATTTLPAASAPIDVALSLPEPANAWAKSPGPHPDGLASHDQALAKSQASGRWMTSPTHAAS